MKKILLAICMLLAINAPAQVTITQNDMPFSGDNLYRTRATLNPFLNYGATGTNYVWNFTNLSAANQDSAIYQTVGSTNFIYALTYIDIFFNANRANHARPGTDIAFNALLPVTNPYTFYYRNSSVYKAVGFGMELTGIPVPVIYTNHDEIYSLPIDFGNTDSSFSSYNLSLPTLAYYGFEQNRYNEVDGWGIINTPAGSFDALRIKTTLEIHDTLNIDSLGIGFAIDRPVIREYKWLSPGLRIPVMQVNTTELFGIEIISDIFFYDLPRSITVVPPLASVICPGNSLVVPYDITGVFNAGGIFVPANIFRAQLSDATGDFTNAVTIGSVTANVAGTITCIIPANTPPGTGYRIRVISTSPAFTGADNGFDITVGTLPAAVASAGGPTQFCEGGSVTLSALTDSAYTYQWQLDGTDLLAEINPDHIATMNGSYTVVVTNACGNTTSAAISVIVDPSPAHSFSQTGYTACNNGLVTILTQNITAQSNLSYQWYANGNLMTGEITDSLITGTAGTYTLEITNGATGCMYTANVNVVIDSIADPLVSTTGNLTFCDGDSVMINVAAMAGVTYQWQLDGIDILGAILSSVSAITAGTYTVTGTSVNGCMAVSAPGVDVIVNPLPVVPIITATGNTVFCVGGTVQLDIIPEPGVTYEWQLDGIIIPGATGSSISVSDSGSYTAIATSANGCISSSTGFGVQVNQLPAAPVILQSNDTLYASGTGNFQWYLDGILIPGATNGYYIPVVNGDYTVTVSDTNSCINISIVYSMTNVGIAESASIQFQVYPNPSGGIFQVTIENKNSQPVIYQVIDPAGKEILSSAIQNTTFTVDMSDFANGIYFLKIRHSEKAVSVIKLVKN